MADLASICNDWENKVLDAELRYARRVSGSRSRLEDKIKEAIEDHLFETTQATEELSETRRILRENKENAIAALKKSLQ